MKLYSFRQHIGIGRIVQALAIILHSYISKIITLPIFAHLSVMWIMELPMDKSHTRVAPPHTPLYIASEKKKKRKIEY